MEDVQLRTQPRDSNAVTHVDFALIRMCLSAVLVHSVSIRKLPHNLRDEICSITISVNGSSYTCPGIKLTAEGNEKDYVMGADLCEANGRFPLYKMRFDNLHLLFPGGRPTTDPRAPPPPSFIANPREFPDCVKVTLHTEDLNRTYGSTMCKGSGEASYLSYPRGEVRVNFRVYPVVDAAVIMEPLYNRNSHFARQYLLGPPAPGGAIEDGASGEAPREKTTDEDPPVPSTEPLAAPQVAVIEEQAQADDEEKSKQTPPPPPAAVEGSEEEGAGKESGSDDDEGLTVVEKTALMVEKLKKMHASSLPDPLTAAVREVVPCSTEEAMNIAFSLYDENKGFITREQLLHFCRAHEAYADYCEDDEELLRSLHPYIPTGESAQGDGTEGNNATNAYCKYMDCLYYPADKQEAPIKIDKELFYLVAYHLAKI